MYVINDLGVKLICSESNSYCDLIMLEIKELNLILTNVYRPPGCPAEYFNQSMELIKSHFLNYEMYNNASWDYLVLGDFNFPFVTDWNTGCISNITLSKSEEKNQAQKLFEISEEFFLRQIKMFL